MAYRDSGGPNQPGWRVRVVPNKFPALGIEGDLSRTGEGMFDKMSGVGAHDLDRNEPRQRAMPRFVDLAHAPAPQTPTQLVATAENDARPIDGLGVAHLLSVWRNRSCCKRPSSWLLRGRSSYLPRAWTWQWETVGNRSKW